MSKEGAAASPYRKLELGLWADQRFARLSRPAPNAQSLWVYLLAGPRTMNVPGIVVAREAVIADDLRWPLEAFREAFREVIREGMAEADWEAGLVVLSKAFFDGRGLPRSVHRPQSLNVVIGWARRWDEIPECPLKDQFYWSLRGFLKAIGEGYEDAFAKACPEPSPIQEQEKEQKQEQEKKVRAPRAARPPSGDRQTFIHRFTELFSAKNLGTAPDWKSGKAQGHVSTLLAKEGGVAEAMRRAENMFCAPPPFPKPPFDIGTLVLHWDKFVQPHKPNGAVGYVKHTGEEEYAGGEVDL